MNLDSLYSELTIKTKAKIALVVMDGVGDIATPESGNLTPLEAAKTPNLDALAKQGALGRMIPVAPGITPGSGPGHISLFGYDPIDIQVGRGVLEALGLGMELKDGDVAARANFCTLDKNGIITDRRAGRIPSETCAELCAQLSAKIKKIGDVEIIIRSSAEHRFVVVFRGTGLEGPLTATDPSHEGLSILEAKPENPSSIGQQRAAKAVMEFYKQALPIIASQPKANGFLMRGFANQPKFPPFAERYHLSPASIAVYPMYKGIAQLVGMHKIEGPKTIAEQFERYSVERDNYDFFFIHYKYTDSKGENGDFEAKKKAIEDFDAALPVLLKDKPDVIAITGDHSTPCPMKGHSWHPQPVLIVSKNSGTDKIERFTETHANGGSLGIFEAKYLMRILQAHAGMLEKFGA